MKSTLQLGIRVLALVGLLSTLATAQSLGEYARRQRALKPATPNGAKVYTNDNLPTSGAISEVGQLAPPPPPPLSPQAAAAEQRAEYQKAEEQKKQEGEWRDKFAEQKKIVARLQSELDLLIREDRLRQSAYSVSAERLQGSAQFAQDEQRYQGEIDAKRQESEEAKQKVEGMKEDLRKAGLPLSWAD